MFLTLLLFSIVGKLNGHWSENKKMGMADRFILRIYLYPVVLEYQRLQSI